VVQTDERWHPAEHGRDRSWAWTASAGALHLKLASGADGARRVQIALLAIAPRTVEIGQDGRPLWRGELVGTLKWIELPAVEFHRGRARLELGSGAPPVREGGENGRALGFAVYGVRLD